MTSHRNFSKREGVETELKEKAMKKDNIFTKWLATIKMVTNNIVSWIIVSTSLFVLGGMKALRHGHLYRGLREARDDARARGNTYITTRKIWNLWGLIGGRVHLVLDVATSKAVLSRQDQFEKAAYDSEHKGSGASLLNAGDDQQFWASVKSRLMKEAVPQCIATAKRLSANDCLRRRYNFHVALKLTCTTCSLTGYLNTKAGFFSSTTLPSSTLSRMASIFVM
jgi:hypothetical protein